MLHKTRGIVLQSIKYSESSNILKIYTEAFGLKSYMIRGLRKAKSRIKASLFQHLSLLELVVYNKERKEIQNIKEVKPAFLFNDIPFNIHKSSIALFMNELINKSVKEEESNPELFHFLYESILRLDQMEKGTANFHLVFGMHFTKYLGFYPMGHEQSQNRYFDLREGIFEESRPAHADFLAGENTWLIRKILNGGLDDPDQLKLSKQKRNELLNHIMHYYQLHLPDFTTLKSLGVLQSIYN